MVLAIAFFNSCKDDNDLGLNILPPDDQIGTHYSDTSTVITNTVREDSTRGDELTTQLLGADYDPVTFGRTAASIFTQVTLTGTPAFPDSVVADSLVLSLAYDGFYGDTTTEQNFYVYRMSEQIMIDSSYYTNRRFLYDPTPVGQCTTYKPTPNTKVIVDSTEAAPQIRIPLAKWLADSLLALDGQLEYSSNVEWLAYFKGLYIKADSMVQGPGAISYLDFFNSYMTLYFHDTTDSAPYTYNFSLKDGKLNAFYHDYTGTKAGNSIGSVTDTINYLQSMSGLKTKISFPYLKHFTDSGSILINRAELQISSETGTLTQPIPSRLLLVTQDAGGNTIFPIDFTETSGYYGGGLNGTNDGYRFIITRHLQAYLDGSVPNADFYLIISGSGVEATRSAIRSGSNTSGLRMKLILSYTKTN